MEMEIILQSHKMCHVSHFAIIYATNLHTDYTHCISSIAQKKKLKLLLQKKEQKKTIQSIYPL